MKNKLAALALIMSGLCSCHENSGKLADDSSTTIFSLGVNDSLVMRYVTCSKGMIDTLIVSNQTIVKNLNEHYCLKYGKSFKFTQDMLYEYFGDN